MICRAWHLLCFFCVSNITLNWTMYLNFWYVNVLLCNCTRALNTDIKKVYIHGSSAIDPFYSHIRPLVCRVYLLISNAWILRLLWIQAVNWRLVRQWRNWAARPFVLGQKLSFTAVSGTTAGPLSALPFGTWFFFSESCGISFYCKLFVVAANRSANSI